MSVRVNQKMLIDLSAGLNNYEYTKSKSGSRVACFITSKNVPSIQMCLILNFKRINDKNVLLINLICDYQYYRKISKHGEKMFLCVLGVLNYYPGNDIDEIAFEDSSYDRKYGMYWQDGLYEIFKNYLDKYTNLVIAKEHRECIEFENTKWFGFEVKEKE